MAKICNISFHYFPLLSLAMLAMHVAKAELVPIFIFGDSTHDVGTNNFLPNSGAKANFPYNGIDFPNSKPTGRFNNGFNGADHIARLLGYEMSPPPFLLLASNQSSFKKNILRGANFASGGAGILDKTGIKKWKEVVSMTMQIQQFKMVCGNITEIMGPARTASLLSKSLFFISVGSNDIFDYEDSYSSFSKQKFMSTIQFTYYNHLKNLYGMGARKFGIANVGPVGCVPSNRAKSGGKCMEKLNELSRIFHTKLEEVLHALSSQLKQMKYSLGNYYQITMRVFEDPSAFGFKEIKTACCGGGRFNGESPCLQPQHPNLCPNRQEYLFWDLFHPTAFAAKLAARELVRGGPRFMTPMNFSELAAIDSPEVIASNTIIFS